MRILYFSWVKDKIGKDQEEIELQPDLKSISDLIYYLSNQSNDYKAAFSDLESVKCSINMEVANLNDKISNEDEIAFFPPMTGG